MELDRSAMKKLMALIAFAIILFVAVQRFDVVIGALFFLINILTPFLAGAAIAFVLNVPMSFLERKVLFGLKKYKAGKKLLRPLSLLLTIILVLLVILIVMLVVIPQLTITIAGLGNTISSFIRRLLAWAQETFENNPQIEEWIAELTTNWQKFDWEKILNTAADFLGSGASDMLTSTISAVGSVISGLMSSFIAIIFSIYILLQKEKLGRQSRKILYAILPEELADRVMAVFSLSFRIFSSFITGQCMEALILGSMFFVTMSLFQMPYALLVGCLISVTALIPIVGAFIGCGVGAFLLLMVSPTKALIFVIMFLILQQIEGNLIYPHVVGNSVGLPSIWVLLAVTLGGSLFGITGMLFFIPVTSVVYTLFRDFIHRRLKEKHIKIE